MRIDAHQHFWKFVPARDAWITSDMSILRRDFMPADLAPLLAASNMGGCVLVQSEQSAAGNDFMLQLAAANHFIKGIVAWVDLRSDNLRDDLEHYREMPVIKGFRHILQGEKNRTLMLEPSFMRGIKMLGSYNYTYDILIFKDQLKYVPEFVKNFPGQLFVIDHLAKPDIRSQEIAVWEKEMRVLSSFENVYCKISGMFAEADWNRWKPSDFPKYLDVVLETFGASRLMYGSDWPVCLLAASYSKQLEIVEHYFSALTANEKNGIFGNNAKAFYGL